MAFTYDNPALTYDDAGTTYEGLPFIFDDVTISVEFGFGYAPLATEVVWQPVTSYVRSINVNRGRSSEFSTYSPGTCTLTVDNRDRRFDPEHTTGPFYGDLNPMVPMRVTTSYSGTTYTLFYGFVQGWPTAYNQSNSDAVSTIVAVDGTRLLHSTVLVSTELRDQILARRFNEGSSGEKSAIGAYYTFDEFDPTRWVDQLTGETLSVTSSNAAVEPFVEPHIGNVPVAEGEYFGSGNAVVSGSVSSRFASPYSSNFGGIQFWHDASKLYDGKRLTGTFTWKYSPPTQTWKITFDDGAITAIDMVYGGAGGNGYQASGLSLDITQEGGANLVFIGYLASDPTKFRVICNNQSLLNATISTGLTPATASDGISFDFRGAVAHFLFYVSLVDSPDIAADLATGFGEFEESTSERLTRALNDASWPAAWRDIDSGVQQVGYYDPSRSLSNTYIGQIEAAEQGALFVNRDGYVRFKNRPNSDVVSPVALFDDDNTDFPFAGVQVDANTVDAIRNIVDGRYKFGTVSAEDSASVAAYGPARESVDLTLIDNPSDARDVVEARLAATKDPRTRVRRLDVNVRADTSMVPTVAALELADDVTVSFTPTGVGDELWRAVRVQGLSHTITLERWDCQLYLAPGPINTNGPLMLLDDDEYGKLSSGNKLG